MVDTVVGTVDRVMGGMVYRVMDGMAVVGEAVGETVDRMVGKEHDT